jgi:hypothetical protein
LDNLGNAGFGLGCEFGLLFVQGVNLGCYCCLDVGKGCKVIKSKFDVKVRVCGFDRSFATGGA